MRVIFASIVLASLAPIGPGALLIAADSTVARTSVVASAEIRTRTSIVGSTDMLRFHVTDANQPADAILTFAAGARAAASSEVLLLVSTETTADASEMALTVSAGPNTHPIIAGERVIAMQWIGGGLRSGELRFQLRAAPGTYTVPVKLHLIVP
jgi:hypothetical protein